MEDNPYVELVKKLIDEITSKYPTTHRLGRVLSVEPLEIEVSSLVYEQHELLKSEHLITFSVGDEILLLPIDEEQRFIIIAKVVDT